MIMNNADNIIGQKPRRKSAAKIGTQKAIKTAATRKIKAIVKPVKNPLAKTIIIATLGAVASYLIYKD